MKIGFEIRWHDLEQGEEIDSRLFILLLSLQETGSLQAAANESKMSYRTAWDLINYWNKSFHSALVIMERGRGTQLTTLGKKLLNTKYLIDTKYADELNENAVDFNKDIEILTGKKQKKKLFVFASNDLAITHFQELCDNSTVLDIDFQSQGSLDALKQLHVSKYNIAGFHFPEGVIAEQLASEYMQLLNDEKHLFIHLATRQQGLIFKPSLSDHITDINSITRRSVKFINRQRGSGTRAIFDQLIKLKNINKKNINGYGKEEFTHTAVAAMISSGHADVGFGLKAAAVQFKLAFLPLITETYIIAINKSLPNDIQNTIRSLLKNNKLKSRINKLPGYNSKLTGKVIHANKLLTPVSRESVGN